MTVDRNKWHLVKMQSSWVKITETLCPWVSKVIRFILQAACILQGISEDKTNMQSGYRSKNFFLVLL